MLCFFKVGDYHKIIKEPMDFGTMRAKLHEGMYATFEQFEVCSISPNLPAFLSSHSSAYSKNFIVNSLDTSYLVNLNCQLVLLECVY